MPERRSLAEVLDATPIVRASRFRFRAVRARGVPAILCGVASIVLAAGAAEALRRLVGVVPETLREARLLLVAIRGEGPAYLPPAAPGTM